MLERVTLERKGVPRWQRCKLCGCSHGRRAVARKQAKDKRNVAMETAERVGRVKKTEHTAAWCPQGGNQNLCAIEEDERETIEETRDNDEELQALCLLEGSNNEQ